MTPMSMPKPPDLQDPRFKAAPAEKRNSVLPKEADDPGGWANKTTGADDAASVEREWKCEAF